MCAPSIEKHGASPANIQWSVVRGDSATLKVEFFEDDEKTYFDTTNWTFLATAYDPSGDFLDDLPVVEDDGFVEIKVPGEVTQNWGDATFKTVVAELPFDLQVTITSGSDVTTWTPVVGTICVLGDVTPGGIL
jgi:hypothetical protein